MPRSTSSSPWFPKMKGGHSMTYVILLHDWTLLTCEGRGLKCVDKYLKSEGISMDDVLAVICW